MWRLMSIVVGLSLTGGGANAASAAKSSDGPPPHFPVTAGDTAIYRWTIGDSNFEHTERVTEVVKTRDGVRVTVERASKGKPAVVDQMDVSANGVTQVQVGGKAVDPPVPELRLPAKAGDTWEWEAPGVDKRPPRKISFKVVGEEEVEVPAGKFKAIRVERVQSTGAHNHRTVTWYAPAVGVVKRVSNAGGTSEAVQELKVFTPGTK